MNRPTSAMITVRPAKMTALPEVARDLPIDSLHVVALGELVAVAGG